jgi:hypothetical protein
MARPELAGIGLMLGLLGDAGRLPFRSHITTCPFRRSRSAIPAHLDQAFQVNAISGVWGA